MFTQVGRIVTHPFRCIRYLPLKLQRRNTHMVKPVRPIPPTPAGQFQRPPAEKEEWQRYDFVQDSVNEYPPVKVILLKSVDVCLKWTHACSGPGPPLAPALSGLDRATQLRNFSSNPFKPSLWTMDAWIGRKGDVVSVASQQFHESLFPSGSAIYATPYDLHLLEQKKLAGDFAKLDAEDMVSFEHKKLARVLNSTVVKITMTYDQEWSLEKWHLRVNLRRAGFVVSDENIVLPYEEITGPNKNLQGKLLTFYVKHSQHCIVPVLGRIEQASSKGQQLIIAAAGADRAKDGTAEQTAPPVYYSIEPITLNDDEICALMTSKTKSVSAEGKATL